MNVSSSRAPPPNVTTTAFWPRGATRALSVDGPKKLDVAAAPAARRRKLRLVCEMAWATACGLAELGLAGRIVAVDFMILRMWERENRPIIRQRRNRIAPNYKDR